jgi:F-type H+-transporting ATPase subunit gamma
MTSTVASLRRKIVSAGDLQSVVRTMKAVAASSIGQYENCVQALGDYSRTVELGLSVCIRHSVPAVPLLRRQPLVQTVSSQKLILAVVFATDQGLVGRFNDVVAEHSIGILKHLPGKVQVWAVGERVRTQLTDAGLELRGVFPVPNSVKAITPLIGRILLESENCPGQCESSELYLFYNRPAFGSAYGPVSQRLLPLDTTWHRDLAQRPWPTKNLPEVMAGGTGTLRAFVREYLFVSLFRACAESLASEHASRLAAMQRADRNIDELLEALNRNYHRLRQSGIDEELFDVVSGFEALSTERTRIDVPRESGQSHMGSVEGRP